MLSSVQAPVQNLCVQVLAKMSQGVFFPCGRHQASSTEMSLPFTTSLTYERFPKELKKTGMSAGDRGRLLARLSICDV